MKEVKNLWNDSIEMELELEDIEVDKEYSGNRHISPSYLQNAVVKVVKKGRKNVVVTYEAYPGEKFSVEPRMLNLL